MVGRILLRLSKVDVMIDRSCVGWIWIHFVLLVLDADDVKTTPLTMIGRVLPVSPSDEERAEF